MNVLQFVRLDKHDTSEMPDLIKGSPGLLYGISNPTDQPGKTLTLLNGETILCHFPLDKAFSGDYADEVTGETVRWPGIVLKMPFTVNLRARTDGRDIFVYWNQ
jgi:hypothetical protein